MRDHDNPFLHNNRSNKLINSTIFRVGIGLVIGGILLGGVIILINSKGSIAELPETGDEDAELEIMNIELDKIEGSENIQKLARVGREYIFYTDLEYYAYQNLLDIESLDYDSVLDYLVDESVLLQAGENEGWVELDSETFNNPFKDFSRRGQLVLEIKESFNDNYQSGTYVEIITVWFYNSELGDYAKEHGIDAAKELAKSKIDEVYSLVTEDGKSMEEAAQIIIDDSSLSQLDENYDGNAYGIRIFPYEIESIADLGGGSENLYKFLESAQEGDISEIFLERDIPRSETEELVDAYYAIYKLTVKVNEYSDMNEWVDSYKTKLKIEIL